MAMARSWRDAKILATQENEEMMKKELQMFLPNATWFYAVGGKSYRQKARLSWDGLRRAQTIFPPSSIEPLSCLPH